MAASNASRSLAATVGGNIRSARAAAGLTQHELAIQLGTGDAMTVSRWERGEHRPSDERLLKLAEVLRREVAWFYAEHAEAA